MKNYVIQPPEPSQPSNFRRRFENELNPQQFDVATAADGPYVVLAGAGTGKTRAVTYRVAYLLDSGVGVDEMILLTFTNKAAREMLRRVEELVAIDSRQLWGGTFHRAGNLILRRHGTRLGYSNSYTILDREDARDLVEATIAEVEDGNDERRFPRADVVAAALSFAANTRRDIAGVLLANWPMFADLAGEFEVVAKRYAENKRELDVMDYDDLLVNVVDLLREHDDVRRTYAGRFRHVLVDEFQDSNRLQAELIELLSSEHGNVMVVGDDAQSIYSFRGAERNGILEFSQRHADAQTLKLEINYRSTPNILDLANAVIAGNVEQLPKTLRPVRRSKLAPALVAVHDARQQAAFVASRVLELRDEGYDLDQVAIVYRSHWHCLELQMELSRRNIPYEVRSGLRFFESAHVKDMIAHLRVIANPRDQLAWRRILKLLPRVGNRTAEKIYRAISVAQHPLEQVIGGVVDGVVPKAARKRWTALRSVLGDIVDQREGRPADMIRRVLGGGYSIHLYESYPNAESRIEDLDQLALFALSFESLESFLSELALSDNLEAETVVAGAVEEEPRLVLTTIHQAKGLEWRAVFVVWLVDGRFPSARSLREDGGEEEERRLFYVAVTRTRDELYLCYPVYGRDEYRQMVLLKPSRFVPELPEELYETWRVSEPDAAADESVAPSEPVLFDDLVGIDDDHVA